MGDVFPGKTRGPRAEKQPYVPDPLPKGVQSMGDVLPGMTKPARPVRKRQEPGRWDGVGEKPSPKPCQDCRPPQSVRRGEATQFKAGNYFGKPSRPKKIKVSAAGAEIRALDTYGNRVDIKKNDAVRGAIMKEKLEHDRAHIYLAKLWEEKWTAAKRAPFTTGASSGNHWIYLCADGRHNTWYASLLPIQALRSCFWGAPEPIFIHVILKCAA
jgi:hypothetical protein